MGDASRDLSTEKHPPWGATSLMVAGGRLDLPTLAEAAAWVVALARRPESRETVLLRDAHGVVAARRDARVAAAQAEATLVLPDGMPLVWLARAHGKRAERVYGPDLMLAVCAAGLGGGLRHGFLGGAPGVAERLATRLGKRFPGLLVSGCLAPQIADPTRPDPDLVASLPAADILWVGLGCPKQDLWMATHRPLAQVPVMIGVGAAFNIHAGLCPQAPGWMRRRGLEWAFRLATEPARLGPRYARVVPEFAALAVRDLLGRRCAASSSTASSGSGSANRFR